MAGISTSCRREGTRYTRLNLLGWAMLCPYALELIKHGSTPMEPPSYPTSDEAKDAHEKLKHLIRRNMGEILSFSGLEVVNVEPEYFHQVFFSFGDEGICANSKADLVYTVAHKGSLYTLYIEVTTRIHVAKPWQTLLRELGLYYERRLPVWLVIVSPEKLMYKVLTDHDQEKILKALNRKPDNFEPHPNLCSLCELADYCPYKVI